MGALERNYGGTVLRAARGRVAQMHLADIWKKSIYIWTFSIYIWTFSIYMNFFHIPPSSSSCDIVPPRCPHSAAPVPPRCLLWSAGAWNRPRISNL